VSRDEYFLKVKQIKPVFLIFRLMVFKIFWRLAHKKSKVWLASMKLLTNFENHFSGLHQSGDSTLRMLTGSRLWPEIVTEAGYGTYSGEIDQWQRAKTKNSQWQKKGLTEILTDLPEQYLELVSVFSEASRKFLFLFSSKKSA
jgi:hypothetical protein